MKNLKWMEQLLLGLALSLVAYPALSNTDVNPVGYWKTIDDVTGKPKSIVEITEDDHHILYGKVTKIFPQKDVDENKHCTECSGELKNKKVMGMTILWNLKQNEDQANEWSGGSILDPKTGKIYSSLVNVIDNGQKLRVRGYFGVALLGRTQVWLRVDGPRAE